MAGIGSQVNKALVLEAFDTLFNRRDYATAERFWTPRYIQLSAHIAPGQKGLLDLIRAAPPELRYEPGLILAEGDHVMVHGRFSGNGRPHGSRWTSSESRTVCWPNTGMCCRMKRPESPRPAASQCSAPAFRRSLARDIPP